MLAKSELDQLLAQPTLTVADALKVVPISVTAFTRLFGEAKSKP